MNKKLYPDADIPTIPMEKFDIKKVTKPVFVDYTFKAKYMLVYGTLRLDQGNWEWSLKHWAKHLATMQIPGIQYRGGLSAGYTGEVEKTFTVMDLFEIKDQHLDIANEEIDMLESVEYRRGYKSVAFPMVNPENGEDIVAKFYHSSASKYDQLVPHGDYLYEKIW